MTIYERLETVWRGGKPDKLFWSNIRVGDYKLPPDKLAERVAAMVNAAAVNGRQLAFEVSEQWPANWKQSIPVVLNTLKGLSGC